AGIKNGKSDFCKRRRMIKDIPGNLLRRLPRSRIKWNSENLSCNGLMIVAHDPRDFPLFFFLFPDMGKLGNFDLLLRLPLLGLIVIMFSYLDGAIVVERVNFQTLHDQLSPCLDGTVAAKNSFQI